MCAPSEQKVKVGHGPRAQISPGTGRLLLKQQTDGSAHAAADTVSLTDTHTVSEKHQVPTSAEDTNHKYTALIWNILRTLIHSALRIEHKTLFCKLPAHAALCVVSNDS